MSREELTQQQLYDLLMNSDDEEELGDFLEDEDDGWGDSDAEETVDDINEFIFYENEGKVNGDANAQDTQQNKRMKVSEDLFQWQKKDLVPKIHKFIEDDAGCKNDNLSGTSTILDVFEAFFSRNIMEKIKTEINKYLRLSCKPEWSSREIKTEKLERN